MPPELSRNEPIKEASRYLRGTLAEGLAEEITGGIVEDDQQLVSSTARTCRTIATYVASVAARKWSRRSPSWSACASRAGC